MLKIIFLGTADFGGSVLEKLADSRENSIVISIK
jgi:methionyl-tRNA formyltransferase